jgi:hypothetical protein
LAQVDKALHLETAELYINLPQWVITHSLPHSQATFESWLLQVAVVVQAATEVAAELAVS